MPTIVQKFGGTSVADPDRIRHIASLVKKEVDAGNNVIVVVSAMAGHTNQLVGWSKELSPVPDLREYDTVLSAGEQITAGLTALAIQNLGIKARSFLGWQMGLETDGYHSNARISGIQQSALANSIGLGEVCVCAGFQGITPCGRITTLGRGGSDTSAVAIAAAMSADRCDIYTDVDGVYSADPRMIKTARKQPVVSYDEMLELASAGAKVLHPRSVMLAMKKNVRLRVLSSFSDAEDNGTEIVSQSVFKEIMKKRGHGMEQMMVSGVTVDNSHSHITLTGVPDKPGSAVNIFTPLSEANIDLGIISQVSSRNHNTTRLTFTIRSDDVPQAREILEKIKPQIGFDEILVEEDVSQVSVVGIGMRGQAGIASKAFKAMSAEDVNIKSISTSEIRLTMIVAMKDAEKAATALHTAFNLDVAED